MSKRSKIACCVYGCLNKKSKNVDCQFFSLPTDETRRNEWLRSIGRTDLLEQTDLNPKSCHVCSVHFEEDMLNSLAYVPPNAVPSKFLPNVTDDSSNDQILEYATATIDWDHIILNPPEINPLEAKAYSEKDVNEALNNKTKLVIPGVPDDFDKTLRQLLEDRIKLNTSCSSSGKNKYSKEFLFYALNMLILNPQAYNFIREDLNLPTEKALRNMKLKLSSTLGNRVLDTLASKLKSFPDKAKYCTLCVQPMFLKPNLYYDILNDELVGFQDAAGKKIEECATLAYVMMLRGILVEWDQPISYCFLTSVKNFKKLEKWIDTIIAQLFELGFEVMALVSNQGSNLGAFARDLKGISPEKIYFTVNDKKIYYIYEFPALLKCIRNHFMVKDLCSEDNQISMKHIEALLILEKQRKYKLAPFLTNNHVKPTNFNKMIVSYATEIFSKTVSDAIHTYVDMEMMPEEARQTANFCLFLNNLYDVLNSSTYSSDNVYKTAFGSHDSQMKLIDDALVLFGNLCIKSSQKKKRLTDVVFLASIQVTLRSLKAISKYLSNVGHKYILTQRLNQDSLDVHFNLIRRRACTDTYDFGKPTPVQFCREFSKLYIQYILKKSRYSIRPGAFEKFFKDASELRIDRLEPIPLRISQVALNGDIDYRIKLPRHNPNTYIASFLFYKSVRIHTCTTLEVYIKTLPDLSKVPEYKKFNKKAEFYGKLKLLHAPFLQYVKELDMVLLRNFQRGLCLNLGAKLFEILENKPFDPPCNCFPKSYMIKLLIRLRIYYTIKRYNETLARPEKKTVKQFLVDLFDESY